MNRKNQYGNNAAARTSGLETMTPSQRPFSRINYILMGACLAAIIIGFLLMAGPGSSEESGFNPDIFSTRRIVVGPTITFLGFLGMAFAIIAAPGKRKREEGVASPAKDEEATVVTRSEATTIDTGADEKTSIDTGADEKTRID